MVEKKRKSNVINFIETNVRRKKPFFVYINILDRALKSLNIQISFDKACMYIYYCNADRCDVGTILFTTYIPSFIVSVYQTVFFIKLKKSLHIYFSLFNRNEGFF